MIPIEHACISGPNYAHECARVHRDALVSLAPTRINYKARTTGLCARARFLFDFTRRAYMLGKGRPVGGPQSQLTMHISHLYLPAIHTSHASE